MIGPALLVAAPGELGPGLSLAEFVWSEHHQELVPANLATFRTSASAQINGPRIGHAFGLARLIVGPMRVTSGFRCPALNRAVGGSGSRPGERPSAHLDGRAVDVVPLDLSLADAMNRLCRANLGLEKIIFERGAWLHLQVPRIGEEPPGVARALQFFGGRYEPFDPADPRVRRHA